MIRYGTIQEEKSGWATVMLQAAGGATVTPMLPVVQRATVGDKDYRPLDQGTLVALVLDENGEGIILGAVYNDKDMPPVGSAEKKWVTAFADGTKIAYDKEAKKLSLSASGAVDIEVLGSCSIEAQSCNINASSGTINGLRCQFTGAPRHNFG